VPAGTFGGSEPPSDSNDSDEETQPGGEEPTRPGLRRVSAQPPPVPRRPAEDAVDPESESERRKRYVSTLVGHPSGGSATTAGPQSPAPMLAPPRWTGAGAYVEGQEPQPRVSALPAPQHVPLPPSTDAEPSRARITTKVGHVQVQPLPAAVPESASRLPPIGDAIQEMLDSQTAVSMQVEEPRDAAGDEELPIDELQIEEILDGLSEAPPPLDEPSYYNSRGDEPTLQHVAPPPPDAPAIAPARAPAQPIARDVDVDTLRPPASPPRAPAASVTAAAPPRAPAPPAAPPEPPKQPPKAPPREAPRARRAAVEVGMHAEGGVSSLAPAEVARRPRYRDDSQAGVGVLLLAAMAVIGVGGWYLTRGSYPGARPSPAQASAPADPATAAKDSAEKPSAKSGAVTPAGAATAAATQAPVAPAANTPAAGVLESAARREAQDSAKRAEPKPHPIAKADDATRGVVKITPRPEPAELPDIPSRDNVVAALAPLRSAVAECAHGQRGVAQLDITVANTGAVTHAIVGGDFAGTAEGSCIARAARSAAFVPFKKPRFRVIYPFSL
jgi:hypothetical protein